MQLKNLDGGVKQILLTRKKKHAAGNIHVSSTALLSSVFILPTVEHELANLRMFFPEMSYSLYKPLSHSPVGHYTEALMGPMVDNDIGGTLLDLRAENRTVYLVDA